MGVGPAGWGLSPLEAAMTDARRAVLDMVVPAHFLSQVGLLFEVGWGARDFGMCRFCRISESGPCRTGSKRWAGSLVLTAAEG